MSGLATSLRTEATRLRGLQREAWRLETVARIKLDEAARLSEALATVEAAARDAADGARNLRRSVRLRPGGGLTQHIEFLETQAKSADRLADSLEGAARLTADLFPDDNPTPEERES